MRLLYLLLTVLVGLLFNLPYHNFQDYLAQGDHGRDLYAAQAVLAGDMPYKDFWWVYGPLMPYYYAAFFKMFGVQITSVLLGKILLNTAAGAFFFLALWELFPGFLAFMGAVWFIVFHQDFFFTYNHAGGIALLMAAIWMHVSYIRTPWMKYAWTALFGIFVLGLVKINFAITTLVMTLALVAVKDLLDRTSFQTRQKRAFYACALFFIPVCWVGVYSFFIHGLTPAEVRQCLPYLGGDEPYNSLNPLQTLFALKQIILKSITTDWVSLGFCFVILLCTVRTLYTLFHKQTESGERKALGLLLVYAVIFYFLNQHEFLKSGVFYRTFWAQPLSMLLMFTVLGYGTSFRRTSRVLICTALVIMAGIAFWNNTEKVNAYKNPQHLLGMNRTKVYVGNDRLWLQTVALTTRQLNTQLMQGERFLALPYDCLYYYLTDKKSPTRQLIFFDHIKIPTEQEQRIIAELENNEITAVLVSSRQSAHETGLGTLGVTYCPLIAQYINTKFTPTAKIGDWENEPGWAWNHGTLLLKRKQ